MHKQIACSALSLAVTLTTSLLPPYEIDFSHATPPSQPVEDRSAPDAQPVRFIRVDLEHEFVVPAEIDVQETHGGLR